MNHKDEWKKRRQQEIRETACKMAKTIHITNTKSHNKNLEDDQPPRTTFAEDVIEDASTIEQYIKNGQKVYKD